MRVKIIFFLGLLIFGSNLMAQDHEHIEDHHEHHKNEIGIANSPVYFVNEKEFTYGLHIHYVRSIKDSRFGVGLGYERIFDEHKHNTISVVGSFRPEDKIVLIVSPGITFEDDEDTAINFALHLESSYEFEISDFHIGPLIEIAYDPEDIHLSLGLHIGFGF